MVLSVNPSMSTKEVVEAMANKFISCQLRWRLDVLLLMGSSCSWKMKLPPHALLILLHLWGPSDSGFIAVAGQGNPFSLERPFLPWSTSPCLGYVYQREFAKWLV
jgi:hypothetical protein